MTPAVAAALTGPTRADLVAFLAACAAVALVLWALFGRRPRP